MVLLDAQVLLHLATMLQLSLEVFPVVIHGVVVRTSMQMY